MKQIVLFGTGKIAEVLLYFLRNESDYEVVACTVHRTFLPGDTWQSLPVVAFDEVERLYPPATHAMFVALGYQELNALLCASAVGPACRLRVWRELLHHE